uniref:Kelch-like protein diablo n=1 Tax=Glossina pallidipes TaxID=7398 RepID=A0A1A9ZKX3_GLOPL
MIAESADCVEQFVEETRKNPDYGDAFLHNLNKMRIDQENCDFSVEVGGETMYVHKVALAVASPYFAGMFRNNMKEKAMGSMKLENSDATAVKAIIDYIYSGEITLTEENVQLVYSASDYFQIEWIKKKCMEYFERNLSPANCFQVRKYADQPPFKELYGRSHNYILKHFDKLIHKEELLRLSFEEIEELIKDDRLAVGFEDNAYKAIMNWVKYDLEERRRHLAELMSHIRLPSIRNEFLRDHVVTESLLKDDRQCNEFLFQLLHYQLTPVSKRSHIHKSRDSKFHVLLAGGVEVGSWEAHRSCKIYDVSNSTVCYLPEMAVRRSAHSLISLNEFGFSVGGYCGKSIETAERFDPVNHEWIDIAPMDYARYFFGICAHSNLIYAIGGSGLSSVESYNALIDRWYACPDTPVAYEWWCRACTVENSIYNLGRGVDGITSCIRFDPREGQWFKLNEMPGCPQKEFELVAYDRSLFFISRDCAQLDIRTNKWDSMPSMPSQRLRCSATIIADDIYVIGGGSKTYGGGEPIKSVERYNIHNSEWTVVDSIEIDSCNGAAVLIRGDFNLPFSC